MVDLSGEMGGLWATLGAPAPGRARVILFTAARAGEGTSTVAREFARFAARRAGKTVWLIDLDLQNSPQHAAIAADPVHYGALGKAASASPDGSSFLTVQPPQKTAEGQAIPDARYIAAHQVGENILEPGRAAGRLIKIEFEAAGARVEAATAERIALAEAALLARIEPARIAVRADRASIELGALVLVA